MEMDLDEGVGAGANLESSEDNQVAYLPLVDCEGKVLELHFLTGSEVNLNLSNLSWQEIVYLHFPKMLNNVVD